MKKLSAALAGIALMLALTTSAFGAKTCCNGSSCCHGQACCHKVKK